MFSIPPSLIEKKLASSLLLEKKIKFYLSDIEFHTYLASFLPEYREYIKPEIDREM
jgi:hypothetical protein